MTITEIESRLKRIRFLAGDPEAAHSEEDQLLWAFVAHVRVLGSADLRRMAKKIEESLDIEFPRWCA